MCSATISFERHNLLSQLQRLEASTDMMVLDGGAGLSRNVMSFALAAAEVLVVTTPEPTALTDAYATIKALCREGSTGGIGLFVNKVNSRAEATAAYERIANVARRFLDYFVADYGYMLHDTTVELAVQERCPFVIAYPRSNASACIAAMAAQMARALKVEERRGGLFKRAAALFV